MLITGFTADHMQMLANENIVDGSIGANGHLMLEKRDGTLVDAGYFGLSAQTITVATDFNTLVTPGTYLFLSNSVVVACANLPTNAASGFTSGYAGFMMVEGNGTTFVKQTYTNYNAPGEQVVRTRYNTTTWYGWMAPIEAATATQQGIVELATPAEVTAQTDNSRAVTPLGLASMAGYRLLQTVIFTASGTFTKASYPTARAVRIRVVGGGGAGGTAPTATTGNHAAGGGGGGGGYAEKFALVTALATSETVTVGAGGGSGSGGKGYDGGASSFGTMCAASGGVGGETSVQTALMIAAMGGSGGMGTAGDLLTAGDSGSYGTGNATLGTGGPGGSSALGGGGIGTYSGGGGSSNAGNAGKAFGGGGGGASTNAASSVTAVGGVGGNGVVIVEVYV